jgi:hypothetical protein
MKDKGQGQEMEEKRTGNRKKGQWNRATEVEHWDN